MKTLIINPDQPISNLQQQFTDLFPFLKLECFKSAHQKTGGSAKRKMHTPETHLGTCMHGNKYGSVSINPNLTVAQLEQHLKKEFGLNIQIFRKSGKVWLETTTSDIWTLKQQNEEGRNSINEVKEEMENADEHDIY